MFNSWSRTQRNTLRPAAGDSPTSQTANPATRRYTQGAFRVISPRKTATTFLLITRLRHELKCGPNTCRDLFWEALRIATTPQTIDEHPRVLSRPGPRADAFGFGLREQEEGIHAHYGRTGYWPGESKRSSVQPDCSHPQYAAVDRRKLEHAWQVAVTGENRSYRNGICPFETCYPGMASALRPR